MQILVTGATGFIGRAVCQQLLHKGYSVCAAVRQFSSILDASVKQVIVGDFNKPINWDGALNGINAVIHLAARVHVMQESAKDPLAAFRAINFFPTVQLAQAAASNGVKRFIYVSSVKVNGEATILSPFSEHDATAPQDAYAISKWEAEQALQQIASNTKLEVTILRPPLVYGPSVGGNFINLLKVIYKGFPLPFKNIHNQRSMIYVDNLADALVVCATHFAAANQTFLVSDGEDISTSNLISVLCELLHKPNRLFYFPSSCLKLLGVITGKSAAFERILGSLQINNNKICNALNWQPLYTVQEGLEATVKWFLNNYDKTLI